MMNYRADIDGMRALAVVPVVLFHANVPGLAGGFIGVDIFFVISGYLITNILIDEIRNERFSLLSFYERRLRRLLPALFAMLLVSSILAAWLLLPAQLVGFAQSVWATVLFVSNIVLWRETGYFSALAAQNPLLHTWSLAVEEQFYVFFPLFLLLLVRLRWRLGPILWGLLAFSFAASAWGAAKYPAATFYLLPTRAWELGVGSVLALGLVPAIGSALLRQVMSFVGVALIVYGITSLSKDAVFPGVNALLPCVGAALLIHAGGSGDTAIHRLLSLRWMVLIGKVSYPLYLWHWPLLVFGQFWFVYELTPIQTTAIIAVSVALSFGSWVFLETPIRNKTRLASRKAAFLASAFGSAAALALAGVAIWGAGLPSRVPKEAIEFAAFSGSHNPRRLECLSFPGNVVSNPCIYGADVPPTVAVWGDSHADSMIASIGVAAEEASASVLFLGSASCPPLLNVRIRDYGCIDDNAKALKRIEAADGIKTVVLIARFPVYVSGRARNLGPAERHEVSSVDILAPNGAELTQIERRDAFAKGLQSTVDALVARGLRTVIVYPVPEVGYDVPTALSRLSVRGIDPATFTRPRVLFDERTALVMPVLDAIQSHQPILRLRPDEILCDEVNCMTYRDGAPLYRDDDHLSRIGADALIPLFSFIFH